MAFCKNCGSQYGDNTAFCEKCGNSVNGSSTNPPGVNQQAPQFNEPYAQQQYGQGMPINLLQELSQKVKTQGIIWVVIACLQVLIGIVNIITGMALMDFDFDYFEYGSYNFLLGIFILIVAALNFVVSNTNFKYSKEVITKPVGIVKRFEPIGGLIGSLIYNLFFGGVIGVAGIIYSFTIRSFVTKNIVQFNQIESEFLSKQV